MPPYGQNRKSLGPAAGYSAGKYTGVLPYGQEAEFSPTYNRPSQMDEELRLLRAMQRLRRQDLQTSRTGRMQPGDTFWNQLPNDPHLPSDPALLEGVPGTPPGGDPLAGLAGGPPLSQDQAVQNVLANRMNEYTQASDTRAAMRNAPPARSAMAQQQQLGRMAEANQRMNLAEPPMTQQPGMPAAPMRPETEQGILDANRERYVAERGFEQADRRAQVEDRALHRRGLREEDPAIALDRMMGAVGGAGPGGPGGLSPVAGGFLFGPGAYQAGLQADVVRGEGELERAAKGDLAAEDNRIKMQIAEMESADRERALSAGQQSQDRQFWQQAAQKALDAGNVDLAEQLRRIGGLSPGLQPEMGQPAQMPVRPTDPSDLRMTAADREAMSGIIGPNLGMQLQSLIDNDPRSNTVWGPQNALNPGQWMRRGNHLQAAHEIVKQNYPQLDDEEFLRWYNMTYRQVMPDAQANYLPQAETYGY